MTKITRRKVLAYGLAAGGTMLAAASCQPQRGPTIITNKIKDVTLRLIGSGGRKLTISASRRRKIWVLRLICAL